MTGHPTPAPHLKQWAKIYRLILDRLLPLVFLEHGGRFYSGIKDYDPTTGLNKESIGYYTIDTTSADLSLRLEFRFQKPDSVEV